MAVFDALLLHHGLEKISRIPALIDMCLNNVCILAETGFPEILGHIHLLANQWNAMAEGIRVSDVLVK
eukprot:CAMPEP_0174358116 /NCGR_PEP_ID=MMETSP0811_2-20130205/40110_1 /TAXON_ID=73025 ORGANISM="Eutreptiella gymnastica-like, Strain CCMP1594" /NCGR_SAMPLE_ID=MMETSP0811_2 /ASSEMBLY_ACC=CAM_ASM_000667 /LENGTH=67 /DNA_ID=CAMNT_0015491561 /DNA_START=535 /DNA_END=735 /DNA_ORIENTATION=+